MTDELENNEAELGKTESYEQPIENVAADEFDRAIKSADYFLAKIEEKVGEKLRDQFAMAALSSLAMFTHDLGNVALIATLAYQYADAMLLARKTPVKTGDK